MQKKRSVGVIIFGVLSIIFGDLVIMAIGYIPLVGLIFGVSYIISGLGIFMLKEWARRLILYLSVIFIPLYLSLMLYLSITGNTLVLTMTLSLIFIFSFPIPFILYFRDPKVKEKFK